MDMNLACPPPRILADLVQGRKVEPELSELSAHLEACPVCQERARRLHPHDTLVDSLRGEAPVADQIARSAPRPLIEKLKQISRYEGGAGPGATAFSLASTSYSELHFLAPPLQADELGRLGHYRVLKLLGQGGMGAVFRADDPKLDRHVALKVMLPGVAANPRARERFLREARAVACLKSEHIVTIYQVDETNGVPFLAMELLEGQSLDDLLDTGARLKPARIVALARDIAHGLAVAHEKGLVHRDIKPGNLWIEGEPGASASEGRVKILDFGLAHAVQADIRLTQSGAILGTPAYMAPEQARGDKAVDGRADLFSLGCVLYRLCAGDIPFQAETTMGTLLAITVQDPVPLAQRNDSIPSALSALVKQLLEKDPSRRPPSARDVIARLSAIEQSLARPENAAIKDAPADADTLLVMRPASRPPPRKRGPLTLAIGGLLLVALTLAGAVFLWQAPDGQVVSIESNDPKIKVAFADGELKVTGAYQRPIVVKPGKLGLKIIREEDDFEFQTDKLVVSKGDRIVLRIDIVDGQVQLVQAGKGVLDAKTIVVADPDRRAAQWVLTLGGSVEVNHDGRDIRDEASLPMDRFTLTGVKLRRLKEFTNAGLRNLKGLAELGTLQMDNTPVQDDGLAHLQGLSGLTFLDISGTRITDTGLAHLRNFRSLRKLFLDSTAVTDAGLVHLAELKGLTMLVLAMTKVTDDGMVHLLALRELQDLSLHGTRVSDPGLARLRDLPDLASLNLSYTAVSDTGLDPLRAFPKLAVLHLCVPGVTDQGLARLKEVKGLTWLDIQGTRVTPEKVEELRAALPGCRIIHDSGAAAIVDADRKRVERLLLLGGSVRIEGDSRDITAPAGLPRGRFTLTGVVLAKAPVTDADLAPLKAFDRLTHIDLRFTRVGDAGIAHLKNLRALTELNLAGTGVTSAGLAHLKSLKALTSLNLGYTKVGNIGLKHLRNLKELSDLRLSITSVSDAGLEHLKDLRNLKQLYLNKTMVTNAGLAHLKGLTRLTELEVRKTGVTAQGLADFHAAVPQCRIEYDDGTIAPKAP